MLDGVLFFPVTPFGPDGEVDYGALATHVDKGVAAGPGGVFVACGTGEFHALGLAEFNRIVRETVEVVGGRVPVFAGAGGSLVQAKEFALAAEEAGADGLLLLPPYLVAMPPAGLASYVEQVAAVTDLPMVVYNRGNAVFDEASAVAVAKLPTVVGLKDGTGDLDNIARIVLAVRDALPASGEDFLFFNGRPTAETTQQAYRSIGVTLYSSAAFAFVPEVALAYYRALEDGDTTTIDTLNRTFYHPLVRLRDKVSGYAVALIKAGVTQQGIDAGAVRAPLVMPTPEHLDELNRITEAGRAALG